jgi:orotate phosphoribosyltransferase
MRPPRTPRDYLDLRNKAFKLIKNLSFSRGRFTLASGRESNYYLDMKPTMLNAEGAEALSWLILKALQGTKVQYIGGLALGAVPLLSSIAVFSTSTGRGIGGFYVRKEVKEHGTKKLIEGVEDRDLKDRNVVILDDVTTTGESAMRAVKAAQDAGAKVELVLSMVDREEGAAEYFEKQGIKFRWLFRGSELLRGDDAASAGAS